MYDCAYTGPLVWQGRVEAYNEELLEKYFGCLSFDRKTCHHPLELDDLLVKWKEVFNYSYVDKISTKRSTILSWDRNVN